MVAESRIQHRTAYLAGQTFAAFQYDELQPGFAGEFRDHLPIEPGQSIAAQEIFDGACHRGSVAVTGSNALQFLERRAPYGSLWIPQPLYERRE
jgi:hypothetical protein